MTLGLQLIATPPHTNLKKQQQAKKRAVCGGCHICKSIWTAGISKKLACRTEGTADPDFDNFAASLAASLASCIIASCFCSTAAI